MNFDIDPKVDEFRARARTFLEEAVPPELRARRFEWPVDRELQRRLAQGGYLTASWTAGEGGGHDALEMLAFYDEANRAGVPLTPMLTTALVARILLVVGTPEQRATIVADIVGGEAALCLGYSEPDSGSDVASARTTAVRDGDRWIINGQKIYTSFAETATHVLLLTRTNTSVPKHRGLTMFLVPTDTSGFSAQPLKTLAYHHTNMTFYDDVVVSDSARVGEVDGGWDVMKVALAFEHGLAVQNLVDDLYEAAVEWARTGEPGHQPIEDPNVRERLARVAVEREISDLFRQSIAAKLSVGRVPGADGNCGKLFQTEAYIRASQDLLDLVGPDGLRSADRSDAPGGGVFDHSFRDAPMWVIAGGSSEVMRDVIAERHLGLPRQRPRADAAGVART